MGISLHEYRAIRAEALALPEFAPNWQGIAKDEGARPP